MTFYSETLGLSDNAFYLLRDLIHERTGLFYENGNRDSVADKLSPLVIERGFGSFLDYYYLLKYDPSAADEWGRVMDALSVQETYFWREADQFQVLCDHIAPQWAAERPGQPLRIWSAACATGEEPLSILIALKEAGWLDRMPIEVYASDASPGAIARAQAGRYRERSFRNLPITLRNKYFQRESDNTWRVNAELHSKVRWAVVNLLDEAETARMAGVPVIFCRNVFIYFSEKAIRATLDIFARRIMRPGYLFVGAAESLLRLTHDFELQEIGGVFVYVRT